CAWTPTPAPTLPSAPARVGRCARSDARSSATSPARSTDTSTPPRPPPRWPLDIHRRFNGRLEHLRGSALGFRNLTNYIARSLLETGGFRPQLHGSWDIWWGSRGEAASDQEHAEAVVVEVAVAAGDAPVQLDDAVHGLGSSVGGAVGGEVGQERVPPAAQRAAEPGDLGDRATGHGADQCFGSLPALGQVCLAVGGAQVLGASP